MKILFMSDYQDYKAGDVEDLPEDVADDLHQSGVACPYHEPAPKEADKPRGVPKKGK